MELLLANWWIGAIALAAILILLFIKPIMALFGVVLVSEDKVGIVTKKFSLFGQTSLPDGALIALNGEAGVQADTLAPGLHLGLWAWQYRVHQEDFVEVPAGYVGVVEAHDGLSIPPGRTFANAIKCDSFQDARSFLSNGGQRGSQIDVIRPGVYRINTQLFNVRVLPALKIADDQIGLVTTNDGLPLENGDIAGPVVTGHEKWQNGQAFIDNGGYKGRQEEIIQSGTYYVNPQFIQVETVPLYRVPVGYVGVVNAFTGNEPTHKNDDQHANIVKKGERGVWDESLDPGLYPINTYVKKIELVPTTNIVLNWAGAKTDSHELDRNLSTITVRSADGFTFNLDVSQIIHISPNEASKVIARFGSVKNLVSQVLEPLIGNYFRNAAQGADIIDFLTKRTEQQAKAKEAIDQAIRGYSVQSVDTLIGDIVPPAELMETLTDRKLAEQRVATYQRQKEAANARQDFERASANADTMKQVVDAERSVEVAGLHAQAQIKKASGDAESKTITADADAKVLTVVGAAEAEKTLAVGQSEAKVLREKVDAVGANYYANMQMIDFISNAGLELVPRVLVSGQSQGGNGIVDAMLGNMLSNEQDKKPLTETK